MGGRGGDTFKIPLPHEQFLPLAPSFKLFQERFINDSTTPLQTSFTAARLNDLKAIEFVIEILILAAQSIDLPHESLLLLP